MNKNMYLTFIVFCISMLTTSLWAMRTEADVSKAIDEGKDLYGILSVNQDASPQAIESAFRKASLLNHPDKPGGSTEKMQDVNLAHEILQNSLLRTRYDAHLKEQQLLMQRAEEAKVAAAETNSQFIARLEEDINDLYQDVQYRTNLTNNEILSRIHELQEIQEKIRKRDPGLAHNQEEALRKSIATNEPEKTIRETYLRLRFNKPTDQEVIADVRALHYKQKPPRTIASSVLLEEKITNLMKDLFSREWNDKKTIALVRQIQNIQSELNTNNAVVSYIKPVKDSTPERVELRSGFYINDKDILLLVQKIRALEKLKSTNKGKQPAR